MALPPKSVPGNFDDQLESLVARIKSEGWDKRLGIDLKTLQNDLVAQRAEKAKDAELKQAYELHHRTFTQNQGDRYGRFMQGLEIARAAHRLQPEVLKSLDGYKRKTRPRKATP